MLAVEAVLFGGLRARQELTRGCFGTALAAGSRHCSAQQNALEGAAVACFGCFLGLQDVLSMALPKDTLTHDSAASAAAHSLFANKYSSVRCLESGIAPATAQLLPSQLRCACRFV
jgi:hypothetical protein